MKIRPIGKSLNFNNFLTKFFCKTMFSADISWPRSIVGRYHCHGWDGDQKPTSLMISRYRKQLNVTIWSILRIFLAPIVHVDLLLADITSKQHNPILSRYPAWLGKFDLISHMSMPNLNDLYFNMPMSSMYVIRTPQLLNADILRRLLVISYGLLTLPLSSNRQVSLNSLANFRSLRVGNVHS